MEEGQWVLLDNANLCSAAVLDRLNAPLEPGGSLLLNEAGTPGGRPRIIWPHRDFRLFLALDPRFEPCIPVSFILLDAFRISSIP
jgi:midasin